MELFEIRKSDISNVDATKRFNANSKDIIDINDISLHAEELRQFLFCKRVLYWRRIASISSVSSKLMNEGLNYHKQRNNYTYLRNEDLVIYRDKYFWDDKNKIGARIDLLSERENGLYVIEFKRFYHGKVFTGHRFQAIMGGIIAENVLDVSFQGIEIQYYPGKKKKYFVDVKIKENVIEKIKEAKKMIKLQILPEPTNILEKCRACEFQKLCRNL